MVVESQLDANEVKQLLAKGTAERDRLDVERVSTQIDMKSWPDSPTRFWALHLTIWACALWDGRWKGWELLPRHAMSTSSASPWSRGRSSEW